MEKKEIEKLPENYFGMKNQSKVGIGLVIFVFLFVFVWGSVAQISGAVVTQGRVVLESNTKKIQHREGGIVREILVHEGDIVQSGQLLVRLDETVASANEKSVNEQLNELTARKARIEAEREKLPPATLLNNDAIDADKIKYLQVEQKYMQSRAEIKQKKKQEIKEQISQTNHEISGIAQQISALNRQHTLVNQELKGVREVYDLGYASFSRLSQVQREGQQIEGQIAQLNASIAQARSRIAQLNASITQIDAEALAENVNDLRDTDAKIAQLREQAVTTNDTSSRLEVKSPVTGRVQQLNIHTIGGVIAPGEVLMIVVPNEDDLLVDAKIDPQKIDNVRIGGDAYVRFTAFDSRTTPQLIAKVDTLSADVENDDKTGATFYRARLRIDKTKIPKDLQSKLQSGQPVEVQIQTTSHSALSYFLKPLTDQMALIFKED